MAELMTAAEHDAIDAVAQAWNKICQVVGRGETREADLGEVVIHIHALQHFVMASAAARAYPDRYRLPGGMIGDTIAPIEDQADPPGILVADHPTGDSIIGCAICTLRIRCSTWPEVEDGFQQLAEHHCIGERAPDAGEPLILPCLICSQDNDVTIHWRCPSCDNGLGYTPEAIEAERARIRAAAERELVTEYLGEGALEVDVIEGPESVRCSCGHHLNQHNGMTTHPDDGCVIASGYCVACPCRTFDPSPLLADVTPEPPERNNEPITPSYTEAEWTAVLERWLATKRTTLIGRAWPATSPEERHVVAAELAGWIIEAAGEILE